MITLSTWDPVMHPCKNLGTRDNMIALWELNGAETEWLQAFQEARMDKHIFTETMSVQVRLAGCPRTEGCPTMSPGLPRYR